MSIRPAQVPGLPAHIEVRRSDRRRRSVSAFREAGRTIVVVPARMNTAEVAKHARALDARLERKALRGSLSDSQLTKRAGELSGLYLPEAPIPASVRWSTQQNSLWGSCTSLDGSIRLSNRLKPMPRYVVDYVLLHELAHLLVSDHGPRFDLLLNRYPDRARACAFLEGVEFAKANIPANHE